MPENPRLSPERSSISPERSAISPERSTILPENPRQSPERSAISLTVAECDDDKNLEVVNNGITTLNPKQLPIDDYEYEDLDLGEARTGRGSSQGSVPNRFSRRISVETQTVDNQSITRPVSTKATETDTDLLTTAITPIPADKTVGRANTLNNTKLEESASGISGCEAVEDFECIGEVLDRSTDNKTHSLQTNKLQGNNHGNH